jgi:tetratricopeptide (TPR) repeat protein
MIISTELQRSSQLRLVRHYVNRLRTASDAFNQGYENTAYGFQVFDDERSQIERWQAWLAVQDEFDRETAALCSELPRAGGKMLTLRLPFSESVAWHELGLERARQLGDQNAELEHLLRLAGNYHSALQHDQAIIYAQQAHDLAVQLGNIERRAEALLILSSMHIEAEKSDLAFEESQISLELYRQIGDEHGIAEALGKLGYHAATKGDWANSEAKYQESFSLLKYHGDQFKLADTLVALAAVVQGQGRIADARHYCEQALDILNVVDDGASMLSALDRLAQIGDDEGDFALAVDAYQRALGIARRLGRERMVRVILLNLGYSCYLQGNFEDARAYLEEALEKMRGSGMMGATSITLVNLIPVYLHFQQRDKAYGALREALKLIIDTDSQRYLMAILVAAVQISVETGEQIEEAARLSGLILSHSNAEHDNRVEIEKLRPRLEATLDTQRLAALLNEGRNLDFDATIAQLHLRLESAPADK